MAATLVCCAIFYAILPLFPLALPFVLPFLGLCKLFTAYSECTYYINGHSGPFLTTSALNRAQHHALDEKALDKWIYTQNGYYRYNNN